MRIKCIRTELNRTGWQVNWKRYIAGVMPTDVLSEININSMKINVPDAAVITEIDRMIKRLSNESLSDYIDWSMILTYIDMLDGRFKEARRVCHF